MDFNFDEIIDEGPVEGKISFITSIDNPIKPASVVECACMLFLSLPSNQSISKKFNRLR